MKQLFTITLILISTLSAFTQTDTTAVPFVSYWSIGDSYDFKITKVEQKWKQGEQTKNDTTGYTVNFLVLDSTETSYRIKWSYETQWADYGIPEEYVEQFSKYNITEVIYKTSEVGDFVEIENWEEISEMMGNLFNELLDMMSESPDVDRKDLSNVMKPLMDIYQTKEGIEYVIFKELQYFHFPMGIEYTVGETLRYEEQLPNMLGGDPIKGNSSIYIESVDFDEGFCVLIQDMELDPDDMSDMIYHYFKKAKLGNKEMKKMMKDAKIELNDHNRFEYYYYPGIPYYIETHRETIIEISGQSGKRVDITMIELL